MLVWDTGKGGGGGWERDGRGGQERGIRRWRGDKEVEGGVGQTFGFLEHALDGAGAAGAGHCYVEFVVVGLGLGLGL